MLQSTLEIFETQALEWGGGGHKFCKITLAIFVKDFPASYHHHPWVRCVVLESEKDVPFVIEKGLELYKGYN